MNKKSKQWLLSGEKKNPMMAKPDLELPDDKDVHLDEIEKLKKEIMKLRGVYGLA